MRLIPVLAGALLLGASACAQPAPDMGPGPMPGPDEQGGPPPQGAPPQGQPMGRPQHMTMGQRFDMANTTNDGRLTLEQAQAAHMGRVVKNFAQIDADRKGYVTKQDIQAWQHAMGQGRQQQPPGQPPQYAPPPQYGQPGQYPPPGQYAPPPQ